MVDVRGERSIRGGRAARSSVYTGGNTARQSESFSVSSLAFKRLFPFYSDRRTGDKSDGCFLADLCPCLVCVACHVCLFY